MRHEDIHIYPPMYQRFRQGARLSDLAAGPPCKVSERQLRRRFRRLERFVMNSLGLSPQAIASVETGRLTAAAARIHWEKVMSNGASA